MSRIPNLSRGGSPLPPLASPTPSGSPMAGNSTMVAATGDRVKLRDRIKVELAKESHVDEDVKSRLVEILEDLDQADMDRTVARNDLRYQHFMNANNRRHNLVETHRRNQEQRDQTVEKRLQQYNNDREKRTRTGSEKRDQRTEQALEEKARQERERFRQCRANERQRNQRLEAMQRRREEALSAQRQRREEREQRRDNVLQVLSEHNEAREIQMDMRAYEKDIAMEMARARRQATRIEQGNRDDARRGNAVDHSLDAITALKNRANESDNKRLERLRELDKQKQKEHEAMLKKHRDRENRVNGHLDEIFHSRVQNRKDYNDKRRQRDKRINTRANELESDRNRHIMEMENSRTEHFQKAIDRRQEWEENLERSEAHRRKLRADRFFRSLGFSAPRSNDYVYNDSDG